MRLMKSDNFEIIENELIVARRYAIERIAFISFLKKKEEETENKLNLEIQRDKSKILIDLKLTFGCGQQF